MHKAYRVKLKKAHTHEADLFQGSPPDSFRLIVLWALAIAAGAGVGWYALIMTGILLWPALAMGVSQALVLVRNWKRALIWAAVTSIGWLIALSMTILPSLSARAGAWVTLDDSGIGGTILIAIFIGVPIMTFAQCLVLNAWVGRDHSIRWFGASLFGFMLATFFGRMMTNMWTPADWIPGLMRIQPLEPRIWVIAAMWGGCMGWATARMPEVVEPDSER